jgi:hypothetical protein
MRKLILLTLFCNVFFVCGQFFNFEGITIQGQFNTESYSAGGLIFTIYASDDLIWQEIHEEIDYTSLASFNLV